jgi:hypothetical protein
MRILGLLFSIMASMMVFAHDAQWEYDNKNTDFHAGIPAGMRLATANYTNTTTGGPSWDRPYADGTCCSSLGPVVYHAMPMTVSATGAYDVTSIQEFDGYLFIYQVPFNPANQTANFVAGDDDGAGGIGTSDILGVTLQAGVEYLIVTTGFGAGDEGSFTNTVTGPGNIQLGAAAVPALNGFGLAALIALLAGFALVMAKRHS